MTTKYIKVLSERSLVGINLYIVYIQIILKYYKVFRYIIILRYVLVICSDLDIFEN